ncbi:hypothetical protein INT44_008663 [Umbelopsis vinacea]|uniref:Major facilitator superfamily (MFS) profile domain-containing protein n=1 Tax=Umbelopsis vinacea TaxID=44442 RepID=A0A8H7PX08_9FUNG|nr:hypothetical protein INT44_008663 [Umbelopsis vinacea]
MPDIDAHAPLINDPTLYPTDSLSATDSAMESALVRKLDTKLLPYLCLMYLFAALDRSSLGNAVLDNFEEDLHLKPGQFNKCVMIFYAGFLLFQVPSNIMLKKYSAKRWLPLLMICWGAIATAHSQVRGYTELMVLRFFLGIWESGFFPGVVYFLTLFYRKSEIATRIALFYSTSVLSHSFAGILAYYILRLRGSGGMAGWQWLFVIEGIPTMVIAVFAFSNDSWYLPEAPETCSWLTAEERILAVTRLHSENNVVLHESPHDIDASNRAEIIAAMTDWKVWVWMLMFFCGSVPNTSVSNFLPIIIKGLGFDSKLSANLMSAPPYMFAAIVMVYMARSSDKHYERSYHAMAGAALVFLGYLLLLILTGRSGLYVAVCIAVSGIFVINPVVNAWLTSNIAPSMKKSVATAMAVSANNSAGLLGSHIYQQDDAPRYMRGHAINLAFISLFMLLNLLQRYLLQRQNRIKAKILVSGELQELLPGSNNKLIGDRQLHFEYGL